MNGEQLRLGEARATDPATSHIAAHAPTAELDGLILDVYRRHVYVGLTDDELVAALDALGYDFHPPTVKTARSRLAKAGTLTGDQEQTRPSDRGRPMIVWRLR